MPIGGSITPYGCSGALVYQPNPACKTYPGKIAFLALVKVGATFTSFADAAEWATKKTAGDVITLATVGSLGEPSPTEEVGFGAVSSRVTGFDWSFTVMGQNLDDNLDFLDRLNKAVNGEYSAIMVTPDYVGYAIGDEVGAGVEWLPCGFTAIPIIGEDQKTQRKFQITGKWNTMNMLYLAGSLPKAAFA